MHSIWLNELDARRLRLVGRVDAEDAPDVADTGTADPETSLLAELSAVARAGEAPACVWSPSAAAVSHGSAPPSLDQGRPKALWTMLMLLVGAALCILLGYLSAGAIGTARQPPAEPWLRSVIAYHAMYSRETVTDGGPASGPGAPVALCLMDSFMVAYRASVRKAAARRCRGSAPVGCRAAPPRSNG